MAIEDGVQVHRSRGAVENGSGDPQTGIFRGAIVAIWERTTMAVGTGLWMTHVQVAGIR